MPTTLSKLLGLAPSDLIDKDAFDPILDLDTRLFIDPHLLKFCEVDELKELKKLISKKEKEAKQ